MKVLRVICFAIFEVLPKSLKDRLLDLWTHSRVRRAVRKRRAAKEKTIKKNTLDQHGSFGTSELAALLRAQGIKEGDVLFVQCSFNNLYTLKSSPMELIQVLETIIGSFGTLLMPAYTNSQSSPSKPFKPDLEPTYTGLLSETFRRSEGVVRSLHPRHSICGRGPLAERLLLGHERCQRADGPDSPFDRMRLLPSAKTLTLGLPLGHISFLHWVEDFEPDKLPFAVCRSEAVISATEMPDGTILPVKDWQVRSDVAARLSLTPLFKLLTPEACTFSDYKGISIGIYPLMPLASELLALRDRGIIHYH